MNKVNRNKHQSYSKGFTIVELLVVIIVIGILAAIIVVAYNGIQQQAIAASLKSDLNSASKKLELFKVENGVYPSDNVCPVPGVGEICLVASPGNIFDYHQTNSGANYTLSNTNTNTTAYTITDTNTTPTLVVIAPIIQISGNRISTGLQTGCAIGLDSKAYCWGFYAYGALGNNLAGGNVSSLVAVPVSTTGVLSGLTIKSIATGHNYACVIASDNKGYCWGENAKGQLGDNSTVNRNVPVAINTAGVLSGLTLKSISTSNANTCVVASNDKAYCWGWNGYGQVGNVPAADSSIPAAVSGTGLVNGLTVKYITTGYTTCAIASDDKAYCWGENTYGQIGNNSTARSNVPIAVSTAGVLSGKKVTAIATSDDSTCAIADDKAYCWGYNGSGQLGDGSQTERHIPVAVNGTGLVNGLTVKSIKVSANHTCAIASDDKAYCWGNNGSGQLGDGTLIFKKNPIAVDTTGVLNGKTISYITVSNTTTCVATSDYGNYCWGDNSTGHLGNGSAGNSSVPTAVVGVP